MNTKTRRDATTVAHARLFFPVALLVLVGVAEAGGRPDDTYGDWFGHIAGGFDLAQGDFGDVADDGWSIRGGATYWPSDWPVGIQLELAYSNHDFSSSAIRAINNAIEEIDPELGSVSGGEFDDWSFSVTGIWSLNGASANGPYLLGGVGIDRVEAKLTDTDLVYYPPFCDPWWWWCVPGGVGPGTVVVASESSTELSWHVGAGYSFSFNRGSLLFVEARYKSIQTDPSSSEVLPLTFGIRW